MFTHSTSWSFAISWKEKKKEKQMRFKNFIHFQHPQKFLNLHLHAVMNFKILCAMKTIIKDHKKVNTVNVLHLAVYSF